MEQKYWELREAMERAYDKWKGKETCENYVSYLTARGEYETFCVKVLEQLMDENSDVLTNLKFI
jgi:hypothetical protein